MTSVPIHRPQKTAAQRQCDEWNAKHLPGTPVSMKLSHFDAGIAPEPLGPTKGAAFVREGHAVVFVGNTPWLLDTLVVTRPEAADLEKAADERLIESIPAAIPTAILPPPESIEQQRIDAAVRSGSRIFDHAEARRLLAEYERTRDALRQAEEEFIAARESLGRFADQYGAKTGSQALIVVGGRAISVHPAGAIRAVEVADCVVVPALAS